MQASPKLEPSWLQLLGDLFQEPWFLQLKTRLIEERRGHTVYPAGPDMFQAMDLCPVDLVKVVVLGQDPYHNPHEAHGLSFSVPMGTPIPPSLVNIYKEIQQDLGFDPPDHGNLVHWAKQGVLLLNSSLSVRAHQPASHASLGWWQFTDQIIERISLKRKSLVFLLWGKHAISKKPLIAPDHGHLILESPHPSPLSAYRGFFGCRHFSKANAHLQASGISPIDWRIPNR